MYEISMPIIAVIVSIIPIIFYVIMIVYGGGSEERAGKIFKRVKSLSTIISFKSL